MEESLLASPPSSAHNASIAEINRLNADAKLLRRYDDESCVAKATRALALATTLPNLIPSIATARQAAIIESHINLGHGNLKLNEHYTALDHALTSLSLTEDHPDKLLHGWALELAALVFLRSGNYGQATEYVRQMHTISITEANLALEAHSYRALGIIYGETGNLPRSIENSQKGLDIFRKTNDPLGQMATLSNLCKANSGLGKYQEALVFGLTALDLDFGDGPWIGKAYLLANVGAIYRESGEFTKAHQYFNDAYELNHARKDMYSQSNCLTQHGRTYLLQKEYVAAEAKLLEALTVGASVPYCELEAHRWLTELHRETKNFEQALFHFEQYHRLHDEIAGAKNAAKIRNMEVSYDLAVAEQEARIYREKADELEAHVAERTRELEVLAKELERAYERESELSELKSRIITTVSHEFRTPLTIINNSADLITLHHDRVKPEKRLLLRKRMREAVLYLTDLLQDIDLVAATNQGEIKSEFIETQFNAVCTQLIRELSGEMGVIERLQFAFDEADETPVVVDFNLLRQIMFNLLTNGLKYSAETDQVDITFHHTPKMTVTVQDKGIGIPEEDIDKIWNLFYRGSNVDVRRGLGLGLYIVKQLVEVMGAEITVISQLDKGTIFTVALPTADQVTLSD